MNMHKEEPKCLSLPHNNVVVHPVHNGWIVTKTIFYRDLIIPIGFFTNGANIPRLMWRFIPPNDPSIFNGVVVHDYLCDEKEFHKADDYFECILKTSKVKRWKRIMVMKGVRTYTKWGRRESRVW